MNDDAELIARIRKILARTEEAGCTKAEAEAAYALASTLMAKHNLDMAQVEYATGLDGDGWVEGVAIVSERRSTLFSMVGALCQEFFFVKSFRACGQYLRDFRKIDK
jgi:Protein of unknown function (DUF2786)